MLRYPLISCLHEALFIATFALPFACLGDIYFLLCSFFSSYNPFPIFCGRSLSSTLFFPFPSFSSNFLLSYHDMTGLAVADSNITFFQYCAGRKAFRFWVFVSRKMYRVLSSLFFFHQWPVIYMQIPLENCQCLGELGKFE